MENYRVVTIRAMLILGYYCSNSCTVPRSARQIGDHRVSLGKQHRQAQEQQLPKHIPSPNSSTGNHVKASNGHITSICPNISPAQFSRRSAFVTIWPQATAQTAMTDLHDESGHGYIPMYGAYHMGYQNQVAKDFIESATSTSPGNKPTKPHSLRRAKSTAWTYCRR